MIDGSGRRVVQLGLGPKVAFLHSLQRHFAPSQLCVACCRQNVDSADTKEIRTLPAVVLCMPGDLLCGGTTLLICFGGMVACDLVFSILFA